MKSEIADKWVAALRSGKYKQGKDRLRTGNEFCCLGVLCDISGRGQWRDDEYRTPDDRRSSTLPYDIQHWAGIQTPNGTYFSGFACLASHNDDGFTFNDIADIIDQVKDKL